MTKRMLWDLMCNHNSRSMMEIEFLKKRIQRLELGKLKDMGYQIDEKHKVIMVPDGDPVFHIVNLKSNWPQDMESLETKPVVSPYRGYQPGGWQWKLIQNGVDITP